MLTVLIDKMVPSIKTTPTTLDKCFFYNTHNPIFLGSKITVNSDCSHKIKRRLFLGRKAMTNLVASLVAQWVKRLPAMWEAQAQSPGREVSLEKEMASHSTTFAWKIPRTEEPGSPWGRKESDTTERLHLLLDI